MTHDPIAQGLAFIPPPEVTSGYNDDKYSVPKGHI